MTNWNERAENERRRLRTESTMTRNTTEAKDLQEAQDIDRIRRASERLVAERLAIFDQIGIRRTLEEIRRDLWRGRGIVEETPPSLKDSTGKRSISLTDNKNVLNVTQGQIAITKRVEKRREERRTERTNMGEYIERGTGKFTTSKETEVIGYKYGEIDMTQGYVRINVSLGFSLGKGYEFSISQQSNSDTEIPGYNALGKFGEEATQDDLRTFLDRSFLSYAVDNCQPDFGKIKKNADDKIMRFSMREGDTVR